MMCCKNCQDYKNCEDRCVCCEYCDFFSKGGCTYGVKKTGEYTGEYDRYKIGDKEFGDYYHAG